MPQIKTLLVGRLRAGQPRAVPTARCASSAVKALGEAPSPECAQSAAAADQRKRRAGHAGALAAIQSLRAVESKLLPSARTSAASSTGLSLGSILLLAALGLAITYGVMGVINMAHGELLMIGAYATYAVQGVFRTYLPALARLVRAGGDPGRLLRRRRCRHAARAHGDPLALRPAAGNPARHLGPVADADPGGARDLRRAERRGRQSDAGCPAASS